jgi:hypothetical protein
VFIPGLLEHLAGDPGLGDYVFLLLKKFSVTSAALNLGITSASFDSFAFPFHRRLLIGSPQLQFLKQSAF